MLSNSEENYLKAIYHLIEEKATVASTNAIASLLETKASSVTEMLKKLADKNRIQYQPYKGAELLPQGKSEALKVVRKHRLWETFLVSKLKFDWDEVHDIAEELEHIKSEKLVLKLEEFLEYPVVDPHGDPIPSQDGQLQRNNQHSVLASAQEGTSVIISAVSDEDPELLRYLSKNSLVLGTELYILEREMFDGSVALRTNQSRVVRVSRKVSELIWVSEKKEIESQ